MDDIEKDDIRGILQRQSIGELVTDEELKIIDNFPWVSSTSLLIS
jgi:hypothetical protein